MILNVEIVEAKDLEAKDANGNSNLSIFLLSRIRFSVGFSDPYCMLGIVPEIRKFVIPQQGTSGVSSDEEGANANSPNENKLGFMKRLKSFRKSTIRRAQGREKTTSSTGSSPHNVLKDKLPAKYIQTTDVKKATLNPIWMEKFRLYVKVFFRNFSFVFF